MTEYRDRHATERLAEKIRTVVTQPWVLMEVCGGQTHSIVKNALEQLLPASVQLVHGPGCPVCVTAAEILDQAIALAQRPDVILCSFGDMLRVPGSQQSLQAVKATGADVRMLYSPMDALAIARANPQRKVVFLAVGFETTGPATALALAQARQWRLNNFFVLLSHFLVPPAISTIVEGLNNRVQGFLAPGHVCAVTGIEPYQQLVARYRVPMVITGFEPVDILQGILCCVAQLERGEARVENPYRRVANDQGNARAQSLVNDVFEVSDQHWRGIGSIANSGLRLSPSYQMFNAVALLDTALPAASPSECISGDILQGIKKPKQCPHFGHRCRPEHPLGAPMVSSEGACAAYFNYQ
nr:hydrogenase formation protein HypD [Aestuariicella hydrocarbonica]